MDKPEYSNGRYKICSKHDFWHERLQETCPYCLTVKVSLMTPSYRDELAIQAMKQLLSSPVTVQFFESGYLDSDKLSTLAYKIADDMIAKKVNFEQLNGEASKGQ